MTDTAAGQQLERLDRLQSIDAIRELPDRYADAVAMLDIAALVALYAPDVSLLTGEVGRAAMEGYFEQGLRDVRDGAGLHTVILHNGNHRVIFDSTDAAHGTVYCHADVTLTDQTGYVQAIMYTDQYVRIDGAWYFGQQRLHELIYGAPHLSRPNDLPDANWPDSQVGRGSLPHRMPTWQEFWRGDPRADVR